MIYLHSRGRAQGIERPLTGRVSRTPVPPGPDRERTVAVLDSANVGVFGGDWDGYRAVIRLTALDIGLPVGIPLVERVSQLGYLDSGDVVGIAPSGGVSVLYRKRSRHNTVLLTERCNSLCLMCSQPPRDVDDSWRVEQALELIDLIDGDCAELGLSGGEPTLLGDDLLRIVAACRDKLPRTALHVLTNGRRFEDLSYAGRLGVMNHPDMMLGVPLYADTDVWHDFVVQAPGAFAQTMRGLYNLARAAIAVEIRVVVHRQTYKRLPELAEFVYRNCPFAAHVALMGLEPYGYANRHWDDLWIDPVDYMSELAIAVEALAVRGMAVSIYNQPLCLLPRGLWPFARRSISDWKNVFVGACQGCGLRRWCSGFFHSATKRHSAHVHAAASLEPDAIEWLDTWHGLDDRLIVSSEPIMTGREV